MFDSIDFCVKIKRTLQGLRFTNTVKSLWFNKGLKQSKYLAHVPVCPNELRQWSKTLVMHSHTACRNFSKNTLTSLTYEQIDLIINKNI